MDFYLILRIKMSKKKGFMERMQQKVFGSTKHLLDYPHAIHAYETAPEMGFDTKFREVSNPSKVFSSRMKMMTPKIILSIMGEMRKTRKSIKKNSPKLKDEASKDFFQKLEEYAKSLDVLIGYAKVPKELIFKNQAILFDNAIVLSMEMDRDKMNKAPSLETGKMVIRTYDELGIRANKITSFLREHGFAAQASHPLGGAVNYPPLAFLAGMGWHGRHGLIITPEYGPCHRLAAVLTNITNLPTIEKNPHSWIADYCDTCGRCIETCPGKAIYETPIDQDHGRKTHINIDKCFPVFGEDFGCSVCIKECMFHRVGYEKLKYTFEKK